MHRPCVPPRDSKQFLAFPDPLALAFSFFIVLSLGSFVPAEAVRMRVSRARTPTERVSRYLRWTFAEKSTLISCVCMHVHVNAFDVSYAAFDRMQLHCRYKSMKLYAPQAFQRLSPSYARNQQAIYFAREL